MNDTPAEKDRTSQRIEKLYAWIVEEPDGSEGMIGGHLSKFGFLPLIGADRERIESYRPLAEDAAAQTGYPIRLKVFGGGMVIDEIARR